MGMIDRLLEFFGAERSVIPPRLPYIDNYSPFVSFNGNTYPLNFAQTLQGNREPIDANFGGLVNGAYKANGIVFACMLARLSLFSEARFMYRRLRSGTPGELFSLPSLEILRNPWPGGTTGDLLARAIQSADLAGNAFILRRGNRLVMLRPDWTVIIHGSPNDPDLGMWDVESELIGYGYQPGGPASGRQPLLFQASEVAHFAPNPDPMAPTRGMSWLTPLIREIEADSAATSHKLQFFVNGATPNLVVTGVPSTSKEEFEKWVGLFEGKHKGLANAYRSLYLSPTMDAKVVGADLRQLEFKVTQGAGETRIAAAAGVPAAVVGISEGLQGSSLNAGNFAASMRRFADLTMRPAWRNMAGSLANIVTVPGDAELWYDDRDIPALKDDIKSAAEVQSLNAQAIRTFVDGGFDPMSAVDAVNAGDLKRLVHTGLYSVQLQPPTPEGPAEPELPEPEEEPEEEAADRAMPWAMLVEMAERRADAAERRADTQPVINITSPDVQNETHMHIDRGAIEVPITVTTPDVRVINAESVEMDASEFAGAVAAEMKEVFDRPMVREVERDEHGRAVKVTERRVATEEEPTE